MCVLPYILFSYDWKWIWSACKLAIQLSTLAGCLWQMCRVLTEEAHLEYSSSEGEVPPPLPPWQRDPVVHSTAWHINFGAFSTNKKLPDRTQPGNWDALYSTSCKVQMACQYIYIFLCSCWWWPAYLWPPRCRSTPSGWVMWSTHVIGEGKEWLIYYLSCRERVFVLIWVREGE